MTACAELKKEFKDLDFKYLAKDFTNGTDPNFYQEIIEFCKNMDVCILVNNVGTSFMAPFDDQTIESIHGLVVMNMTPQLCLSNHFQKVFANRKAEGRSIKGGGILNVSSSMVLDPSREDPIYTATKTWSTCLSNCSAYRYNGTVDVISVKPGFVQTRLAKFREIDLVTCTADETAEYSLRALGRADEVYGPPCHSIMAPLLKFFIFAVTLNPKLMAKSVFPTVARILK